MTNSEDTAALAHDIRNILTPALLSAERLASIDPKGGNQHTERIFRAIDKSVALCQAAMNTFQNRVMARPESFLLSDIVSEAIQLAVPDPHIRLSLSANLSGEDELYIDGDAVCRMIFNLVRNAANAIGQADGFIHVEANAAYGLLTIDVADSGPGVPKRVLDRIFPKDGSAAPSSTFAGLGLPSTARTAAKLGGGLVLRETGSTGTRFTIELPYRVHARAI
ncbi:MAG: HAMP domain-containing sensor histidine kinase [Pseudomonadota bacterium]